MGWIGEKRLTRGVAVVSVPATWSTPTPSRVGDMGADMRKRTYGAHRRARRHRRVAPVVRFGTALLLFTATGPGLGVPAALADEAAATGTESSADVTAAGDSTQQQTAREQESGTVGSSSSESAGGASEEPTPELTESPSGNQTSTEEETPTAEATPTDTDTSSGDGTPTGDGAGTGTSDGTGTGGPAAAVAATEAPAACTVTLSASDSTPVRQQHEVSATVHGAPETTGTLSIEAFYDDQTQTVASERVDGDGGSVSGSYTSDEPRQEILSAIFTSDDEDTSCSSEPHSHIWTRERVDARDDTAQTTPRSPVDIPVLENDDAPDGERPVVDVVEGPAQGTATVSEDGVVTYTSSEQFEGDTDAFVYRLSLASDREGEPAEGDSDTATATITVRDSQPDARDDEHGSEGSDVPIVREGESADIHVLANDEGLEDEPLTLRIVEEPRGTATIVSDGTAAGTYVRYTAPHNFNGLDAFRYEVEDANEDSDQAEVRVPVLGSATITSGGPLTRILTTGDLNCGVNHVDDESPEFFNDTACGTLLVVGGVLYGPEDIPAGDDARPRTQWTPISQSGGAGTETPHQIRTEVAAGQSGVHLLQTDTYIPGEERYTTRLDVFFALGPPDVVRTLEVGPVPVRLYRAGDCFLANDDRGFGSVDPEAGAVGCVGFVPGSSPPTRSERIEEFRPLTAGSRYYEAHYYEVWSRIGAREPFPNTCRCDELIDNGAGLSWDFTLAPGQQVTQAHLLTFSPDASRRPNVEKTADNPTSPPGGRNGYIITIQNPTSNTVTVTSVTDTLAAGFSYVPGSTTGLTTDDPVINGNQLEWRISAEHEPPPTVRPGGTRTLSFGVTVSTEPGTYTNSAGAAFSGYPMDSTGETAPITVVPGSTSPPTTPPPTTPPPTAQDSAVLGSTAQGSGPAQPAPRPAVPDTVVSPSDRTAPPAEPEGPPDDFLLEMFDEPPADEPPAEEPPISPDELVLSLAKPSGLPGGTASVSGLGCEPGSRVVLTIEGRRAGQTIADPSGAFSAVVDLPRLPLGVYELRAQCGDAEQAVPITLVISGSAAAAPGAAAAAGVVLAFFVLVASIFLLGNGGAERARVAGYDELEATA